MSEPGKPCSKCGQVKSLTMFSPAKNASDGRSSWCKACKADKEAQARRLRGQKAMKVPQLVTEHGKTCLWCLEFKTLTEFPVSSRGRLGRGPYCSVCTRLYRRRRAQMPGQRERAKEKTREYRERNPERWRARHREHMAKRRAQLETANTGLVNKAFMDRLYETEVCAYCGRLVPREERTSDHVLPMSRGGLHHPDNIVMACVSCNCSKKDMTLEEWRAWQDENRKLMEENR